MSENAERIREKRQKYRETGYARRTIRRGRGYITREGYREVFDPGHPLADARSVVQEHRAVLFAVLGPGSHPCWICGRLVYWARGVGGNRLTVDHLDRNRLNNALENLRPACHGCNVRRALLGRPSNRSRKAVA